MQTVWILTRYEWDNYSYSGVSPKEHLIFGSKERAERHAAREMLVIVEFTSRDPLREATLVEQEVL